MTLVRRDLLVRLDRLAHLDLRGPPGSLVPQALLVSQDRVGFKVTPARLDQQGALDSQVQVVLVAIKDFKEVLEESELLEQLGLLDKLDSRVLLEPLELQVVQDSRDSLV